MAKKTYKNDSDADTKLKTNAIKCTQFRIISPYTTHIKNYT